MRKLQPKSPARPCMALLKRLSIFAVVYFAPLSPPATSWLMGSTPRRDRNSKSPPESVAMRRPAGGAAPSVHTPRKTVSVLLRLGPWYTATSPPPLTATSESSNPAPPSYVQLHNPTSGPPARKRCAKSKELTAPKMLPALGYQ